MPNRPEDERVKIPALLHLTRLGYQYVSLQESVHDEQTNIFPKLMQNGLSQVNHRDISDDEVKNIIREISNALDNDDLGREFFKLLQTGCGNIQLVDFSEQGNNSWHVVTELPCRCDQDEFRPDITLLINGMPLVFIEVKRPNNSEGIQAERDRMDQRLQNRKFRRFINETQLMIFSNNSEYDDTEAPPLSGAFYATIGRRRLFFNHFRENNESRFTQIGNLDESTIRRSSFTLNEAGLGCGLPGEMFGELLQEFNDLDETSPYDNGLTYQDVSKVVTYPSRQGRAIRIILSSQHFEEPERIVAVFAMDESRRIADWGIRKPIK